MTFNDITSVENLLLAWEEFQINLMDNVLDLHRDLINKTYQHGPYEAFNISDPKPRNIHKATVRDRLLHHAIYRILYPVYDQTFIAHSYSCRVNKGTHKALKAFTSFAQKVSNNHTKTVWILKCDHNILFQILEQRITDPEVRWLLKEVVGSFRTAPSKGLPLGNLTSQLLVNIYMNEFDQWVKHRLKTQHYIRYADDFVFLLQDRSELLKTFQSTERFLGAMLNLELHPNKVSITTVASGVDFLGWVHFPHQRTLRTVTKRRMFRRLGEVDVREEAVRSYLGLLGHGDTFKIRENVNSLKY
jgi:retron-type reverse transcriptase